MCLGGEDRLTGAIAWRMSGQRHTACILPMGTNFLKEMLDKHTCNHFKGLRVWKSSRVHSHLSDIAIRGKIHPLNMFHRQTHS